MRKKEEVLINFCKIIQLDSAGFVEDLLMLREYRLKIVFTNADQKRSRIYSINKRCPVLAEAGTTINAYTFCIFV